MKVKENKFFAILICAIYVITIAIFSISLFSEYNTGKKENSARRFNSITKTLARLSKTYTPGSEKFNDELLANLGNISDIAGMQITYGNELIFSYPADREKLEKIDTSTTYTNQTTVWCKNGIPVTLTASIHNLAPSVILYNSRIAFLVILIATIAVVIYLIIYVKNGTFPKEAEADDAEESDIVYPDIEEYKISQEEQKEENNEDDFEEPVVNESSFENEQEKTPVEKEEGKEIEEKEPAEEEEKEDILAFLNEPKETKTEDENFLPPIEDIVKDDNQEEKTDSDNNEPKGLFCEETGFGWQEYMLTRLDSELVRSASGDQDLSLMTLTIPGIDWSSPAGKEISRIIIETVKFNDLIFNYNEDGVSAIFQDQNIDKTLVTAETLHTEILSILSRYELKLHAFIGISSRSLRLISANRLANESEEAMKRAKEDVESPIVAFRVNPDKFRNFLATDAFKKDSESAD